MITTDTTGQRWSSTTARTRPALILKVTAARGDLIGGVDTSAVNRTGSLDHRGSSSSSNQSWSMSTGSRATLRTPNTAYAWFHRRDHACVPFVEEASHAHQDQDSVEPWLDGMPRQIFVSDISKGASAMTKKKQEGAIPNEQGVLHFGGMIVLSSPYRNWTILQTFDLPIGGARLKRVVQDAIAQAEQQESDEIAGFRVQGVRDLQLVFDPSTRILVVARNRDMKRILSDLTNPCYGED
jgi:hypothetical protein